jgi:hypothetical protein
MRFSHGVLSIFVFFLFLPFVHAEPGFIVETLGKATMIHSRKGMIEQILRSDPMYFSYSALSIILDSGMIEPRGQMKGRTIRLSPHVSRDSEFIKLLVHEVAHYVDIYYLVSKKNQNDPSELFYRISWENKKTKKPTESIRAFISGYGATNQYEDFAEAFTFYVFHNSHFLERAQKNDSLRQKYLFLEKHVFPRGFFQGTDFTVGDVPGYLWDTTKVPVSLKKYLFFLNSSIE